MDEYPTFTSKTEEALRKAKLIDIADWFLDGLRAMTKWAEECDLPEVLRSAGGNYEVYRIIERDLRRASIEDIVKRDEYLLVTDELGKLWDKYIEITVRMLKERCGCRLRGE